jgi:hypothetical protein
MDRQHQYVPVDPSGHYGFLPHHTGECFDPVAEKRVKSLQREYWNSGEMEYWVSREKTN